MALKIIEASDPIKVETLVTLIVGQPGIGKSSMAYTADKVLTLDFDHGAHRAANRKATVRIDDWSQVALLDAEDFAPFSTIAVDTVGRQLDMITAHIIKAQPKLARASGALSLQGYGELKAIFTNWMKGLHLLGKDVVLLAHNAEERDGDQVSERPDIQGGSRNEVIKVADLVGFLYKDGQKRMLDFSPTDRWVGKNCANLEPLIVPDYGREPRFLGAVLDRAKTVLNAASAEAQVAQVALEQWREHMKLILTVEDANAARAAIDNAALGRQARTVKGLLLTRARDIGLDFDKATGAFIMTPAAIQAVAA